jgi:hypothetical protein
MKKNTMNLFTLIIGTIALTIYVFTMNMLAFGFSLLFLSMVFIDSIMYFVKKNFIDSKFKAIGGELK